MLIVLCVPGRWDFSFSSSSTWVSKDARTASLGFGDPLPPMKSEANGQDPEEPPHDFLA